MQVLPRDFYDRDTEVVARELLGKYLVCGRMQDQITETESYLGRQDLAAHARFGKTPRNRVLFGPAGFAYVYLIYGIHYCLNISTRAEGHGVLIRSVANVTGPGRLTKAFGINMTFNGMDVTQKGPLYLLDAPIVPDHRIRQTPRIGVDYAGEWKDKLLRYEVI